MSHWPHSNRRSERALLLRARSLCNRFEITSEQSTLNLTQDFLQSVELFSEEVCSVHAHFVFGSELYIYSLHTNKYSENAKSCKALVSM